LICILNFLTKSSRIFVIYMVHNVLCRSLFLRVLRVFYFLRFLCGSIALCGSLRAFRLKNPSCSLRFKMSFVSFVFYVVLNFFVVLVVQSVLCGSYLLRGLCSYSFLCGYDFLGVLCGSIALCGSLRALRLINPSCSLWFFARFAVNKSFIFFAVLCVLCGLKCPSCSLCSLWFKSTSYISFS